MAVLGLAFKAGTDDLRHSPAIDLVMGLLDREADVVVFDPVATEERMRPLLGTRVAYAAEAALEAVEGADMVVIATGWQQWRELDWCRGAPPHASRRRVRRPKFAAWLSIA